MDGGANSPPLAPNNPTRGQSIAAFSVGCIVLAALLAAALLGLLPANLVPVVIRLCVAVAGAGFTMFLLGYMNWDMPNQLRIGGPLGVFVLLFLVTPGQDIQNYFNKNLEECEANVAHDSDAAESYCEEAAKELPKEPRPIFLLGVAQNNLGKYRDAIGSWSTALSLGADPVLTNYNIAFAYSHLGEYDSAIKFASLAAAKATANSGMRARSWYLIADSEKALWNYGQGEESHFAAARDKYLAFLEIGYPKYKGEADLACLLAVKATLTSDAVQKSATEEQALSHFMQATGEMKAFAGSDAGIEKGSFIDALRPSGGKCGHALSELWTRMHSGESYEAKLESVRT